MRKTQRVSEQIFENIGSKGYGGNKADYINWAKAISGVGQARAIRAYAGRRNCKGYYSLTAKWSLSNICSTVKEKLDPADSTGCGKGVAPIGHRVNVVGAKARGINHKY